MYCSWILSLFINWKWPNFSSKIDQFAKKNDFFAPASTVSKIFGGEYRSKNFLPTDRTGKTRQFDHQFRTDWFIQSNEILKFVKIVKIATEIEAAIFHSRPFIFEMLSNLNEK